MIRILCQQFLEFADIGERLGIGSSGARMRFNRAMPKLARRMVQLRNGEIDLAP